MSERREVKEPAMEPIEIPGTTIIAIVRSDTEWDLVDPATGVKLGAVLTVVDGGEKHLEIQRWRGEMKSYYWHPRFGKSPLRELLADAARYATTNP